MKDDLTRRDFLKAAGLAAAGVAGAAVLSRTAGAQEQEPKKDADPEQKKDDKPPEDSTPQEETRACPQCGALMYKQGRTWTCENCGYSYVE